MAKVLIATGSSTTASGSPLNWADKYHNQTAVSIDTWHNYAVGGAVLSDTAGQLSTINANFSAGGRNVLMMQIGANDLLPAQLASAHGNSVTQWRTDVATFLSNIRAANAWTIGLTTLNPRDVSGFNTNRNIANPLIRNFQSEGLCNFILDFAAHPTYGVDAAASNTSYYPDGTHPSDIVQQSMADTTQPIVDALFAPPAWFTSLKFRGG